MNDNKGVRILSLDAKDIHLSNHYLTPSPVGYNIRTKAGDINTKKFINVLDFSLDLIKLREVYEKVYRRRDFGFFVNRYEHTTRVINVTFKYSVKEFNEVYGGIYVKYGYSIADVNLEDCVDVRDGELIAIQVGKEVTSPVANALLGKVFWYEGGEYRVRASALKTIKTTAELREDLYRDGFMCNGIRYVRFKRSSGSSRVGKCLFIDEKLYPRMHKWEMCGLKVEEGQDIDLAALEAYISLTLSSIIDTVEINPENILVVDDFESTFRDKVIAVREDAGNNLVAAPEEVEVTNSIWDGQSLMDKSLFGKYSQYGMLLLRNRFFKSCCFNCNMQEYFADNGITDVGQLNGFTLAKKIEDVKLITTPSSIKYLKFGKLEDWLNKVDTIYGVVKHEKKTHFFEGRMVQAHYQLLNTLQMNRQEMEAFLRPSIEYYKMLCSDPAVLRNHIKYPEGEEFWLPPVGLLSKNEIVYKLLGLNEEFAETELYESFRRDVTKAYLNNLKRGHVLVNGNYETLVGNPIELLRQATGHFYGVSVLGKGNIHTRRFKPLQRLLGCRSPHINPGNVFLATNVASPEIDRYFNFTEEILCINSIGENVLQRLNG